MDLIDPAVERVESDALGGFDLDAIWGIRAIECLSPCQCRRTGYRLPVAPWLF